MAYFLPCHKEVTVEEIAYLLIDNCYQLNGVPKVIIIDSDPRFVATFWQSLMMKLNTNLNMSTARHPQIDGLITERVNKTIHILFRCITSEYIFNWVSHLPMVELNYKFSINEASKHSLFKVSYGVQPATHDDKLLLLTRAPASIADRLTDLACVKDVVRELLTLSKQRMDACSSRPVPIFAVRGFVFLSSRGLHTHSQKKK